MPEALSASPLLTGAGAFQAVSGLEQIAQGHLDVWWAQPATRDEDLARALSDVAERATPASEVVLMAPAQVEAFLRAYRLPSAVLGLSPDQITPHDDAPARRLLGSATRILLVTDAAQLDPGNTTERWLESHAFRARNEFYGRWRVAVFGAPITPTLLVTPSAAFGDALTLLSVRYSPIVLPGGAVALEATWRRASDAKDVLNSVAWFAHLLAPDGSLVGQHDALLGSGYPWDGRAATLVYRRGILVPPNAKPGEHRIRIGAYTSDGALLGHPVTLNIHVQQIMSAQAPVGNSGLFYDAQVKQSKYVHARPLPRRTTPSARSHLPAPDPRLAHGGAGRAVIGHAAAAARQRQTPARPGGDRRLFR